MPQFLTIAEFMSAARISRPTVCRKIKTGEIPYTKIGERILIPASFLKELEDRAMSSIKTREGA
jgi:excisionase family DNA binding protein